MYFTQSSISALLEKKLRGIQNHIYDLGDETSLSVCKEVDHIIIINQLSAHQYPGFLFVYRKQNLYWVLEYALNVLELIKDDPSHTDFIENERYILNLDAWFTHNEIPGFIVKIGNLTKNKFGLTYHFELRDDEYKIIDITRNGRVEMNDKHFHIEGVF